MMTYKSCFNCKYDLGARHEKYDNCRPCLNHKNWKPAKWYIKKEKEMFVCDSEKKGKKVKLKMSINELNYYQEILCAQCSIIKDEDDDCKECVDNLSKYIKE
jgi:hypothetical protein